MEQRPRIALIHAVQVAMEPTRTAMAEGWPEAESVNLLDDSLSADRAKDAEITEAITDRILFLARYALGVGAQGILFTCSAFGPAIERAARELPIPVLKPNESMFEAAVGFGSNIGMLATFPPAVAGMESEFAADARRLNPQARLTSIVVAEAMDALRRGDIETHNRLLAERAPELSHCDAIILAHFSTSRAALSVRHAVTVPVFTSPDAAVAKLRRALRGQ